jgi:hypothetical protein
MIRGVIEVAGPHVVSGWIHCGAFSLSDSTVLAYVGDRCIGSGKVTVYRKDLQDAGLGDGICGFNFKIRPSAGDDLGSIIVRLQKSDVCLLQRGSRVVGGAARRSTGPGPAR